MSDLQFVKTDKRPERSTREGRQFDDFVILAVRESIRLLEEGLEEGLPVDEIKNNMMLEKINLEQSRKIMAQLKSIEERKQPPGLAKQYEIERSDRMMSDDRNVRVLKFRVLPAPTEAPEGDASENEAPQVPQQRKRSRRTKTNA